MSKRGPQLTKEQRADILIRLGRGEDYTDIAETVGCTWDTVKYYAQKNAEIIAVKLAEYKAGLVGRGLRDKEIRIAKLARLAGRIEKRLEERLDVEEIKISATGKKFSYEVFTEAEIRQWRGLVDDIAKELGERTSEAKFSGTLDLNVKGYAKVSPDDWEAAESSSDGSNA